MSKIKTIAVLCAAAFLGAPANADTAANSGPAFNLFDSASQLFGMVPEPASWALLVLAFGIAGLSLRTRRDREHYLG